MRYTLSQKDASRLTADQKEMHKRTIVALRRVHSEPWGDKGKREIARAFFGDQELRFELLSDGHFPPHVPAGVLTYVDGERLGKRYSNASISRACAALILSGDLTPSLVGRPISHRRWSSDDPGKAPDPEVGADGPRAGGEPKQKDGIVVEDDHVMVHGIRLPRFPNPGPLTPGATDVTVPRGVDTELRIVAAAIAANRPIMLSGDTGTGKTTLVEYLAYLCNANLIHVFGDPEYSPSLWIGHLHAKQGETYWVDGDLPTAMRGVNGNGQTWLFVDELSRMLPENTAPLLPVMQRRGGTLGKLRLSDHPDPDKRIVEAHKDMRIILAMNPSDADFVGTQEVDLALKRRWLMQIEMQYPDLRTTYALLRDAHPKANPQELNMIAKIGQALRDERRGKRIQFPASPDVLETWAAMIPTLGFQQAFEVTVLNRVIPEDRHAVESMIAKMLQTAPGTSPI